MQRWKRRASGTSLLQEVMYAIKTQETSKRLDHIRCLFTNTKPWMQLTFVTIAKICSEHRTIAIRSHTHKPFLKLIYGRIVKTIKYIAQFGWIWWRFWVKKKTIRSEYVGPRWRDMDSGVCLSFCRFEKS